ncbi:hypothetical protein EYF80_017229 [Liparis tanakae]|uniref:Uncharacterized protein n=1 Tax=Liparis tanakae TaxID=230148 RepID=A0A4Z2I5R9_9TELE|nr:hypothetical protein EYF80_017229 [Liparis tanakae]
MSFQDTSLKSSGHQGAAVRCEEDEAERTRLHGDLQRCRHEIQRLGLKVKRSALCSCNASSLHQGAELAQEAPGAPQERSSEQESSRLRERWRHLLTGQ